MKNRHKVLAINPGTRHIGVAVLHGPILLDWSVRVTRGQLTAAKRIKAAKLISNLIAEHEPNVIAVKKLHPDKSSSYLDQLCSDIESIAAENSCELVKYSFEEIKEFFSPDRSVNKADLLEIIWQRHPILINELQFERDSLNPYHIWMFEAVALGTMAKEGSTSQTGIRTACRLPAAEV